MNSLPDLIHMGGYGLYVWGSFAMCAATVVAELALLRLRRRLLQRDAHHGEPADPVQPRPARSAP